MANGPLRAILHRGIDESGGEQEGENGGDLPGGADARFNKPPEVDAGGDRSDVDQAVETLPVLAADGSHDGGGRGDGQSEQDEPSEETYLDEATFAEVVPDGGPDLLPLSDQLTGVAHFEGGEGGRQVVATEEEDVGGEVQRCVEEGVEADEATEADQEGDLRR